MAQAVVTGSDEYVGYEKLTGLSSAKSLAFIPTGADAPNYAIITAETQGLRILGGGVDPTATTGTPIAAAQSIKWTAQLDGVRLLEDAGGAVAHALYFRTGV